MRRRDFIAVIAGATTLRPLRTRAQQTAKLPTIGFMGASTPSAWSSWVAAFEQELRTRGWVDGRTVAIEYRWTEGRSERLTEIALEFVRLKVDVIFAPVTAAALAAREATSTIPIVFALVGDPVGIGLVASLARPGGNVTGFSNQSTDLGSKRLDILREVVPELRRLAILVNVGNPSNVRELDGLRAAAQTLDLEVVVLEVRREADIDSVFEALSGRSDALYVAADALLFTNLRRINDFMHRTRLPTMHGSQEYVEAGGLISYGQNNIDQFRRAVEYVHQNSKGEQAGRLARRAADKIRIGHQFEDSEGTRSHGAAISACPSRRGYRMRRRRLLGGIAAVAAFPICGPAQQRSIEIHRVGYLSSGAAVPSLLDAFRQELSDLGWHEGQDIAINYQFAAGQGDALPALAAELVQIAVDVIVASPTPAALAAKKATATIPIVGIGFDNPIEHGLIASLAHPGGNVTGVSYSVGPQIFGKDLELISQMVPGIRFIAVLSNSANPNHEPMIHNVANAARFLRLEFVVADAREPVEFDAAFTKIANTRAEALFVFGDPMFSVHRERIAQLAARNRLPSMYTHRLHVQAGGLMSYGPSFSDLWRRAAIYVDKILKGAKPADLPVEQPTKYELVINLKTANALGLTVPLSLLVGADEVIE